MFVPRHAWPLVLAMLAPVAGALAEDARNAPSTETSPAEIIQKEIDDTRVELAELDAEIVELQPQVEALDPEPASNYKYRAQRLRLAGLAARRAATQFHLETMEAMQKWRAGDRSTQYELIQRIVIAATKTTDADLAAIEDAAPITQLCPARVWQAAFLEVAPTPVWPSSGAGEAERREREREREQRSSRSSGSNRSRGSRRGGVSRDREQPERVDIEDLPIEIRDERTRFIEHPSAESKLAGEIKKFRRAVEGADRRIANMLRSEQRILQVVVGDDNGGDEVVSDYRRAFKELVDLESGMAAGRVPRSKATTERRTEMLVDLKEKFAAVCEYAIESGAVLPVVEIMMLERDAEDVEEQYLAVWTAEEAAKTRRGDEELQRVVAHYFMPEPADDEADAESAGEQPDDEAEEAPPRVRPRP